MRSREKGQSHFEVTVGKSIPTDRSDRYLGLVQSHDIKPRRRLHEVLKDQACADIIRRYFELYIADIQDYFRCLDSERARAFQEAREVSKEYGRLLQSLRVRTY